MALCGVVRFCDGLHVKKIACSVVRLCVCVCDCCWLRAALCGFVRGLVCGWWLCENYADAGDDGDAGDDQQLSSATSKRSPQQRGLKSPVSLRLSYLTLK